MLCRKIVSIILSKTFEIELSRFNMEGYTCHLNVVIFVSLHFGRTPSNLGKKGKMKNAGNPLQLRAVSVQYSQTITEEKSCLTGGWKERGGRKASGAREAHDLSILLQLWARTSVLYGNRDWRRYESHQKQGVFSNVKHVRACRINKSWSQIDKNARPPGLNSTDLSILRMLCRTHSPALCSLLWSLNPFATWGGVNLSEATTAQNLLLTTVGLILALMEKLLFSYGEPKQRSFSNWRTYTMLDMRQQLLLNGESKQSVATNMFGVHSGTIA